MADSVKSNFIYNLINVLSTLLFPLITFPYSSRVLMAEGIGQVNFYNSIINYVVLLTSIGIPMYGIREIARVRDNIQKRSITAVEILTLNILLNVVGYFVIGILCVTVPQIQENVPLFLLLSLIMILNTIGCPWFYSGVEDFKYITIRALLIRVLGVILLFALVKSSNDLLYYALCTVICTAGNNIINFIRLRKYVSLSAFKLTEINIVRHLKPALAVFVFNLITSIYINLDSVMLGFLSNSASVGYYTAATKLSHMLLSLVSALGTVMLPRLSNLVSIGRMDEFYRLSQKAFNFITLIAFPVCIGLIVLSPTLIYLFSGETYKPAVITLQLISPVIIAISISNLTGLQILYPLGKIKIVTISTCVGALVNFILNILLIPHFSQNGAAIATVAAELSVTISQFFIAQKYIPFKLINRNTFLYLITAVAMGAVCYFVSVLLKGNEVLKLIIIPIVGALVYGVIMIFTQDSICKEIVETVKNKINH